ncbi:hypothetical protein ES703_58821 [subsurface metagenome]
MKSIHFPSTLAKQFFLANLSYLPGSSNLQACSFGNGFPRRLFSLSIRPITKSACSLKTLPTFFLNSFRIFLSRLSLFRNNVSHICFLESTKYFLLDFGFSAASSVNIKFKGIAHLLPQGTGGQFSLALAWLININPLLIPLSYISYLVFSSAFRTASIKNSTYKFWSAYCLNCGIKNLSTFSSYILTLGLMPCVYQILLCSKTFA